jgi:outer membrane murein-binding lipoprotein Lpp
MFKFIIATAISAGCMSVCFADAPPAYIQTQVDNFTQQSTQLKARRDQLTTDLKAVQGPDTDPTVTFKKQELKAQIDQLNEQMTHLEQQKDALQKSTG